MRTALISRRASTDFLGDGHEVGVQPALGVEEFYAEKPSLCVEIEHRGFVLGEFLTDGFAWADLLVSLPLPKG
ncbi:hypothetical protein B7755_018495 [Streptomyces sp. NBS 14/10]|nr:hypothetical protein [Streptomyces sp. NBS 14/10]KAK1179959.1 hypothetical protein B7755_018495 [Streptomyces sp. NBS 14/10]